MKLILHTDGGARGNPGPAAIGSELKDEKGNILKEIAKYIGVATNNEAEYKALVEGMASAVEKKGTELECYLDSELIVKQLNGEYRVKNERLRVFHNQIKIMELKFNKVTYIHVKREKNKIADGLVNQVLDSMN